MRITKDTAIHDKFNSLLKNKEKHLESKNKDCFKYYMLA